MLEPVIDLMVYLGRNTYTFLDAICEILLGKYYEEEVVPILLLIIFAILLIVALFVS